MRNFWTIAACAWLFPSLMSAQSQKTNNCWSLNACIDYALEHNVGIAKNRQAEASAAVSLAEAKAGRLPSLSGSLSQGLTYRPFQETGGNYVNGGIATSAADKAM